MAAWFRPAIGGRRQPVRDGSAEVLLDLARSAQLLVIGRRGGDGFAELTLGSTSQVCTALTRTSTVVVPDDWARGEGDLGMVVVGVDGSDACQAALGFAFEFAAERGAELTRRAHAAAPRLGVSGPAAPHAVPGSDRAQRVVEPRLTEDRGTPGPSPLGGRPLAAGS